MSSQPNKRTIWSYVIPVAVVAALYGLSRVELAEPHVEVDEPEIELRDRFFGVAGVGDMVWAVGKDAKIVRSEDAGETWTVQNVPVATNFMDIAVWDEQTAVAVGNNAIAITTRDGGKTWAQTKVPVPEMSNGKLFRAEIGPDGRVWTVSELNLIAVSADQGSTWRRVTTQDEDRAWNDIAFAGERVCVAGEFGALRCSDDQGVTWVDKPTGLDASLMAIEFRDAMNGVAVGLNGLVISTSDAGETWTQHPQEGLTRHLFNVRWGGERWIAVGDKGLLLFGDESAANWEVTRLTDTDFAWHTGIAVLSDGVFLASGQSLGVYRDGKWDAFGDLFGGG